MREERGIISGDVVVYEDFTLWGTIVGSVTVVQKGKLYMRGTIHGTMTVEQGGRVHVFGNINGDMVVQTKAKVIHSGNISGDLINSGRVHIDRVATIHGKVKTLDGGETSFEQKSGWVWGKGDENSRNKDREE